MAWTEAQRKVINTRNKNLLISAAAGSGKTAVLVERIISMISEGEHPIDIDHLLVVTFTNAAAAQMRERIGKALDKKLLQEPDNLHLQKQISLLQSAQITTIHSFCLNVIRNYFHRIDLDPSFKMAEESETTLMKSDVIGDVLERWYEEGREDFHEFIESYSHSKSDLPVEDLILQLYHFSMSNPWPKEWLDKIQGAFSLETLHDMESSVWMQELLGYVAVVLSDLMYKNEEAIRICNEPDGPAAYLPALLSDREILNRLKETDNYRKYSGLFPAISYDRLSSKKEEGVSQYKKDRVKELREEIKKGLKDLTNQFFFQSPEEMLKDLQAVKGVMLVLFELTKDFMEEYSAKKEEKNLIDFNDLEHFALNILVEEKDGIKVPTRAAMELSEQFDEILIDEYQDSNLVQETILKSISREAIGLSNRFMVGDVKQSIYKFRLAMPELFMEKHKTYDTKDSLITGAINHNQRIDLDKNFRSRKEVLNTVNATFKQIMTEPIGGVVYDEAAALKYGGQFEELIPDGSDDIEADTGTVSEAEGNEETGIRDDFQNRMSYQVELILITEEEAAVQDKGSMEVMDQEDRTMAESIPESGSHGTEEYTGRTTSSEGQEEEVYTKKELEARAVALKIKELVDPDTGLMLFDRDTLTHRPSVYGDIVILLRSMAGWSEIFVNTLMQEGIPAYADTGTGYFQTVEIMAVLNMLRIIDNPRQDIPFAGVLYSPMVGLTATELAMIRVADRKGCLYQAAVTYVQEVSDGKIKKKLADFLELLTLFRDMVKYTPIHELIEEVLEKTGYYYYVTAMPGGERRRANIDMLVNHAVRFEKGSYSRLFHFIRYIEKLTRYEVDFGEASTSGEKENTVRIMSIHKSKGLEFPVVFVSGLSKQFNTQDQKSNIVIHADYGTGPEYIDSKLRTKVPTLLKKVIQKKIQMESLGEELRVLYVAMTRAKEKLIMSGYIKSEEEIRGKDFTFFELASSKSYLDLVLPAMVNHKSYNHEDNHEDNLPSITIVNKIDLMQAEVTKQIFLQAGEEELDSIRPEQIFDSYAREEIKTRFNYLYPYQKATGFKSKMSVSELKQLGQFIDEEQSVILYAEGTPYSEKDPYPEGNPYPGRITYPERNPYPEGIIYAEGSPYPEEKERTEMEQLTIPDFIRGEKAITSGTDRGTLYHRVLELLDLTNVTNREELVRELDRQVQSGKLKESEVKKLKLDYINKFINSDIAGRMRKAKDSGRLYREKQFVIGIKASEIRKDLDSDEMILIQGIMDAFFEEEEEIVLLDYKSDIVESGEQLKERYQVQLHYYRKALEQILKKRVKEMIIYSLYLGKEIRID